MLTWTIFNPQFQGRYGIISIGGFEYATRALPNVSSVPPESHTLPTSAGEADPALRE